MKMKWSKTIWTAFLLIGLFGMLAYAIVFVHSRPTSKTNVYSELIQWAGSIDIPGQTQEKELYDNTTIQSDFGRTH